MPTLNVIIPPMGESILSGVLAKWHVKDGDSVKKDQPLFELETDKITTEGTAEAAGRIALKMPAGTEVKIGQLVATIATDEQAPLSGATGAAAPAATPPVQASDVRIPPSVRRIAAESGVDPAAVPGSGKGGRVTKGDLLAASETGKQAPDTGMGKPDTGKPPVDPIRPPLSALSHPSAPSPEPIRSPVCAIQNRTTRRKLTPLRQRLAQRLVQAQHDAAMLTTFNEVDMYAVRDLRTRHQDDFTKKHGVKLGFMSFFVKAVVHALQAVPAINAQIDGDTVVENHFYDIGVAVSTDRGLMVPVLRDCDRAGFASIEQQLASAAQKAREGKITLADLDGGVFTITNGGVFGSLLSTPILNAPQCAILGMHAIQDRPVAVNGQVVIRPMMYVALSYDHRIVDGRDAVTFLVRLKQAIEDPARLLLSV
jgi:2-oxoglutarate dehydrogenase E2 component (dihydrolipoamide succinyltransferase)